MRKASRDLTQGNIVQLILITAFPIFCGQILQNLYNSVDSIIVGNFVGTTALAAVSSCSDIAHLLVGFFTGLSSGSGVLFSRYFGAKRYDLLHRAIHTGVLFAAILGGVMACVGIIAAPLLLALVNCPDDVYREALIYLRVYLIGVFFTSIYNVASGVLRAVGDTKNPLYFLGAASVTNIVLDILLVCVFRMGVAGVAIATIVSQGLSVSLVFGKMLRTDDVYRIIPRELRIDKAILKEVMHTGLPAAVQTCLISFSNLFLQRYINSFSSAAAAGVGAAKKVDKYVSEVSISIGMATAIFVSQNVGAKEYSRVFQGIRRVLVISFVGVAMAGIPIYIFAPSLIRIFTPDDMAIQYGVMMITTIVPCYYFQSMHQVLVNTVRGFGRSSVAMVTTALGMVVFRQLFLAIAMHMDYNICNVFYSYPVGWLCSAALAMSYYFVVIRPKYYLRSPGTADANSAAGEASGR